MGDGYIVDRENVKHPQLEVNITRPAYLRWLQQEYPYLFSGISKEYRGDRKDVYSLRTIPHPEIYEFKSWYRSGEKQFPQNITLTPTIVKHWYCCDGGLNWPSNSDSGASARLYSVNEDGEDIISSFESVGFEPNNHADHSIYFPRDESQRLLGWMGAPPDGFEYKWEWQNKERYKSKKQEKQLTDENLLSLSSQLTQVAGHLQQITTLDGREEYAEKRVAAVRDKYESQIDSLKANHDEKLEKSIQQAAETAAKEERDKLLKEIYEHPEITASQRTLGECADLTQQMIAQILRS
jgi:hypothetical protein